MKLFIADNCPCPGTLETTLLSLFAKEGGGGGGSHAGAHLQNYIGHL